MRVLDTWTGQFAEIDPQARPRGRVKYAILSHTWDPEGEQTYQELREIQKRYPLSNEHSAFDVDYRDPLLYVKVLFQTPQTSEEIPYSIWTDSELSPKIAEACRVARENGYEYLWIDSCCIDKTSSSELSESINSMYQWYTHADVCYAFLPDVPATKNHPWTRAYFRRSRWFKRGWTLQELIAPLDVRFLSMEWTFIGSKESLADLVVEITRISHDALLNLEPLDEFSVAQRFSWAAERETTREEDRAYSLLGIFDINMPTLYGEGERAFRRLQEEIMRRTPDQSLFAWTAWRLPDPSSRLCKLCTTTTYEQNIKHHLKLSSFTRGLAFLAQSLDHFRYCTDITSVSHAEIAHRLQLPPDQLSTTDYTFTPHGIRMHLPVISLSDFFPPGCMLKSRNTDFPASQWYLVILGCGHKKFPGCLLARVCYIGTSGSGGLIESLQSGYVSIDNRFDLLPVSPATIARYRSSGSQIPIKTLYIPQPERVGNIVRQSRHEKIKLVLQEKTCEALSIQGYTATLRSPDDAHLHTHSVTLSHDTHTVTIDYQHTLREHGDGDQWLKIEAQVKISGTNLQDAPGNLGVPPKADVAGSTVSWKPWESKKSKSFGWEAELGFKDVGLNIPNTPTALMVRLGLTLAKTNHYLLRIELKTANRPNPSSNHNDVAQAGPSENPGHIDVASPSLPTEGIPPGLMPGSWQDQWT